MTDIYTEAKLRFHKNISYMNFTIWLQFFSLLSFFYLLLLRGKSWLLDLYLSEEIFSNKNINCKSTFALQRQLLIINKEVFFLHISLSQNYVHIPPQPPPRGWKRWRFSKIVYWIDDSDLSRAHIVEPFHQHPQNAECVFQGEKAAI